VFRLVEYKGGRVVNKVDVSSGAPIFNDLVAYVNSSDIAKGDSTDVSYAPSLLIETLTVQVNIGGTQVIVSTRDAADSVMHPVVRSKTSEDSQMESKVGAYFGSLPATTGGG
jgi:hypothetical protein